MAIFAGSVAVAGAFSGLLATGISFLNGHAGLAGWQWLFLLEGIPAIIFGFAIWFYMPNYPGDAAFLTPEERVIAVSRMGPFAPSGDDKHFDKEIAKKTLLEPLFWVFAVQYFFMTNSLNAFGYFAPTIVASLGFKGYTAQLLTVPPNVFALIIIISNCWHSDHTKERTRHVIAGLIFVGIGYLLLAVVTSWPVRYFAVFLIACTNAAVLPFLAHRTATVSGSTATALATGGIVALANCKLSFRKPTLLNICTCLARIEYHRSSLANVIQAEEFQLLSCSHHLRVQNTQWEIGQCSPSYSHQSSLQST